MTDNEIVTIEAPRHSDGEMMAVSPLDMPTASFIAALDRRGTNRSALVRWVRDALVEGVDFGKIHSVGKNRCQFAAQNRANECTNPSHWSKPSLWKPGAEKITGMLGVTAHYPSLVEYERAALSGVDLKHVILRCELRGANGNVLADGVGARLLEKEYGDLNKCLKMAEKSALIDATLRLAGLSEVFTQDLEDMPPREEPSAPVRQEVIRTDPPRVQEPPRQQEAESPAPQQPTIGNGGIKNRIEAEIARLKLNRDGIKQYCQKQWNKSHFADLIKPEADRLLQTLPLMASQKARKQLLAIITGAQNTAALDSILAGRKDYPLISDVDWDTYIAPAIDARWSELDSLVGSERMVEAANA